MSEKMSDKCQMCDISGQNVENESHCAVQCPMGDWSRLPVAMQVLPTLCGSRSRCAARESTAPNSVTTGQRYGGVPSRHRSIHTWDGGKLPTFPNLSLQG